MAHQWRGVIREYAARLPMLDGAPVVTHRATDAALAATVDALADLDSVDDVASVLRVEGA